MHFSGDKTSHFPKLSAGCMHMLGLLPDCLVCLFEISLEEILNNTSQNLTLERYKNAQIH